MSSQFYCEICGGLFNKPAKGNKRLFCDGCKPQAEKVYQAGYYKRKKAEAEQMRADAALGRAVRKMPPNHGMLLNHNAKLHEDDRRVWAACFGEFGQNYGPFWGDTPEAALRAAGLMEGEGE